MERDIVEDILKFRETPLYGDMLVLAAEEITRLREEREGLQRALRGGDAGAHQRRRPLCGTTSRRGSAGPDLQRPVEGAQGQPLQRQLDRRVWLGSREALSER
jgi:hypothetical protein